ncbi:MAG TPA: Spy/CpxP family protein refolding chaperone [Polyangiaceae bacterium]
MKTFRTLFPILGVVTALAGCGGEDGPSDRAASALQAPVADAETAAADDERGRPHVRRHHGGPDFLVMAALHEDINLTSTQRSTIEALAPQQRPSHRPPRDKAHGAALATAIRAGKIDVTALQKQPNDAAMRERVAASANALATLHKTLIPEQRVALVDAVVAKRAAGPKARGGKRHGERRGGGELERGPRGRGGPGGMRGPMGLLEDIGVTEAQRTQIEAKLDAQRPSKADREARHEAMKAQFEAMKNEREARLQTFKQASFDAAAFVAPPAGAEKLGPRAHGDRMLTHLAVIVPLLTPEQREKLAQKIEQ